MAVRRLLRVTDLFGLSQGTVRTALTRMTQRGDLTTDGSGTYALAGHLVERQVRQRESRIAERVEWSGRWTMAVVTAEGRSPEVRAGLRRSMRLLRLGEQREGVWLRPDNLPTDRQPDARAAADAQCAWYSAHPAVDDAELAASLWDLVSWTAVATRLRREMSGLVDRLEAGDTAALAPGFIASAAVLRLFQADPLLPDELLERHWPGRRLRADYDHFDRAYRDLLGRWLTDPGDG
jgi:phenylacetic acid degradation operon negative regulatory protein